MLMEIFQYSVCVILCLCWLFMAWKYFTGRACSACKRRMFYTHSYKNAFGEQVTFCSWCREFSHGEDYL